MEWIELSTIVHRRLGHDSIKTFNLKLKQKNAHRHNPNPELNLFLATTGGPWGTRTAKYIHSRIK